MGKEISQEFRRGAIACAIILLAGGSASIAQHKASSVQARPAYTASAVDPSRLIYIKDERVNLCYAVRNSDLEGGLSFTHVPCSHRVEALIEQDAR